MKDVITVSIKSDILWSIYDLPSQYKHPISVLDVHDLIRESNKYQDLVWRLNFSINLAILSNMYCKRKTYDLPWLDIMGYQQQSYIVSPAWQVSTEFKSSSII